VAPSTEPLTVRTRFAPSPTGDLHLGGAWTALASWVVARRVGGTTVLRIEDIDRARVLPGSQARIEEDLRWLGLDWDEGPERQSDRSAGYERALEVLGRAGLLYPCDCSRAEVARVASAPHAGEETVYPGTCRDRGSSRRMKRPPAIRVRVPRATLAYRDGCMGDVSQDLHEQVGDFVVRRGDGVFAYHLAVVVDDLDMGITEVVRGADLVPSTPRQIWLARALGRSTPVYTHVPLVVDPRGSRLEKRAAGTTVRELREAGLAPERVVGVLGHALGLSASDAPATAARLAEACRDRPIVWRRSPWPIPARW